MNLAKLATIALTAGIFLTACSSAPDDSQSQQTDPYPAWLHNPTIANGIAAASCVPIPGNNVSVAQKQAAANGRANLAFKIKTKVKAMDITYDRVTTTAAGSSSSGTFESVSKQLAEQSLSGARTEKFEQVTDQGKNMMCALVILTPDLTNKLFKNLINTAKVNLAPDHEAVLKEQFTAYKAQRKLEK